MRLYYISKFILQQIHQFFEDFTYFFGWRRLVAKWINFLDQGFVNMGLNFGFVLIQSLWVILEVKVDSVDCRDYVFSISLERYWVIKFFEWSLTKI